MMTAIEAYLIERIQDPDLCWAARQAISNELVQWGFESTESTELITIERHGRVLLKIWR